MDKKAVGEVKLTRLVPPEVRIVCRKLGIEAVQVVTGRVVNIVGLTCDRTVLVHAYYLEDSQIERNTYVVDLTENKIETIEYSTLMDYAEHFAHKFITCTQFMVDGYEFRNVLSHLKKRCYASALVISINKQNIRFAYYDSAEAKYKLLRNLEASIVEYWNDAYTVVDIERLLAALPYDLFRSRRKSPPVFMSILPQRGMPGLLKLSYTYITTTFVIYIAPRLITEKDLEQLAKFIPVT